MKDFGWMDNDVEECLWFSSEFEYFGDGVYTPFVAQWATPSYNNQHEFIRLDLRYISFFNFSDQEPVLPPEISMLTALVTLSLVHDIRAPFAEWLPIETLQ